MSNTNQGWLKSPEERGKKDYECSMQAAAEIAKINQEVHYQSDEAFRRMYDQRNQTNREWMELDEDGKRERNINNLETMESLVDVEDASEEAIKAQEAALKIYKQKSEETLAAQNKLAEQQTIEMDREYAEKLQKMETETSSKLNELSSKLTKEKTKSAHDIQQSRATSDEFQRQIESDAEFEIRQMQEETKRQIEEINRKTEQHIQAATQKQKKPWYSRLAPRYFYGDREQANCSSQQYQGTSNYGPVQNNGAANNFSDRNRGLVQPQNPSNDNYQYDVNQRDRASKKNTKNGQTFPVDLGIE